MGQVTVTELFRSLQPLIYCPRCSHNTTHVLEDLIRNTPINIKATPPLSQEVLPPFNICECYQLEVTDYFINKGL